MFAVSIIAIGLATFSKEQGITAIALCFILELIFNHKVIISILPLLLDLFQSARVCVALESEFDNLIFLLPFSLLFFPFSFQP